MSLRHLLEIIGLGLDPRSGAEFFSVDAPATVLVVDAAEYYRAVAAERAKQEATLRDLVMSYMPTARTITDTTAPQRYRFEDWGRKRNRWSKVTRGAFGRCRNSPAFA